MRGIARGERRSLFTESYSFRYVVPEKQRELDLNFVSVAVKDKLADDDGNRPRKKIKGQNKSRPHHQSAENASKLCFKFIAGSCPHENCKYSHDTQKYLETKEADIGDRCYLFEKYGRCRYAMTCRFSESHLKDGVNQTNDETYKGIESEDEKNTLSRELQIKLRKRDCAFEKTKDPLKKIASKDFLRYKDDTAEDSERIKLRLEERKAVDFRGKLYLAPLTTVGNLPFRRICKEMGADITCGEMAMATNLLQGQTSEWALLRRHSSEDIFGIQLCGGYADVLSRCAQLLEEQCSVDFIDLNMGCPIDFIYKKGSGSGLMTRSTRVNEIVYAMTETSTIPLTMKMRAGVQENKNIAHRIIQDLKPWMNRISLFTVHGRSREQRYTKLANWDYIGECVKQSHPEIAIFGSGDVLSFEDYERSVNDYGVDGVLLARGALIKPWLFTEIKERRHWDISSNERLDILKKFSNYGLDHWGSDTEGVERTRRFLLEWLSFLYRYIPVGLLERLPQRINDRPPLYRGRDDLETLMASPSCRDWIRISEMLLGPVRDDFDFLPKHKANAYN
ncbi:tRNA-dihydrouridine(47) synthase [NAD(P)(+)]-like [Galendromus occidentalis]|uniref:tRNA-dihydrouridine(47) synthase [NAD(P)(+)] n=1 Tax=Galendromus occidentalis TaxID=34638 RepID=A0AAJ6QSM6_9ACAR|nr:tRNA-dihydrouridine(47) synthase [NAD(P)(+)]-like [Galendromus occidentalis]